MQEWTYKGKGVGKNAYGYPQYNVKGKSKGKGYQGECWNCGKVGHKASECTAMNANYIESCANESYEIESMWDVGNVRAEAKSTKLSNKFSIFEEGDDDDDDDGETSPEPMPISKTYAQVAKSGNKDRRGKPPHEAEAIEISDI